MNRKSFHRVGSALLALACSNIVLAQPATRMASTSPATIPSGEKLRIVITEIQGMVQVRSTETEKWQVAKVGMELDEGAEFRTGLRSLVRFQIPPDQVITLDRLGTVKVLRAIRESNTRVKTDLGMKYGRTQYDVEEAGVEHDTSIRSPGATLAVRGTQRMSLYDHGPFAPVALAQQPVEFRNLRRQAVRFGQQGRTAVVRGDTKSPAETELIQTNVNPNTPFSGTTGEENAIQQYLANFPGVQLKNLGVFALLAQSRSPNQTIVGALPIKNQLRFTLVWQNAPLVDIDLTVISPRGEIVNPTSGQAPTGGNHLGNNVADKNGVGFETIVWELSFPPGKYTVQADLKSKGSADLQFVVTQDPLGKAIQIANISDRVDGRKPRASHVITAPVSASLAKASQTKTAEKNRRNDSVRPAGRPRTHEIVKAPPRQGR